MALTSPEILQNNNRLVRLRSLNLELTSNVTNKQILQTCLAMWRKHASIGEGGDAVAGSCKKHKEDGIGLAHWDAQDENWGGVVESEQTNFEHWYLVFKCLRFIIVSINLELHK